MMINKQKTLVQTWGVLLFGIGFATPVLATPSAPESISLQNQKETLVAQLAENCRAVSAVGGLRVRQAPSLNAPIVDVLPNGRTVAIENLGRNGWIPISYPVNGYVSANYLNGCPPVPPPTTPEDPPNTCRRVSARGGLFVRRQPNINSPTVGILPNGTSVRIESLGYQGWVPIIFPQNGFVSANYLVYC